MNNDLISRKALYRKIKTECNPYGKPTIDFESGKRVLDIIANAQPASDRYDEGYAHGLETKRQQGEWIDHSEEGYVECPFCEHLTNCEDNIDELHYCWNCGAYMQKGGSNG